MGDNKRKILRIIIPILCVILVAVILGVVNRAKQKKARENAEVDNSGALVYAPQTHDAIGASEGFALTPVDTAEGIVSLIIENGNKTTWTVVAPDNIQYTYENTENSYILNVRMRELELNTATDASTVSSEREADFDIRGGGVGLVFHIKVKMNAGRLCFVTGSCEQIEMQVEASLADKKNMELMDKIKLPADAIVYTTTDFVVGDDQDGKSEKLLRVYYYLGDNKTFLAATDHANKDKVCSILEKNNFQGWTYEKKQQTVSGCTVNCYFAGDEAAAVWDDEGLCYLTFVKTSDMDKLSKEIENIITGSKIK